MIMKEIKPNFDNPDYEQLLLSGGFDFSNRNILLLFDFVINANQKLVIVVYQTSSDKNSPIRISHLSLEKTFDTPNANELNGSDYIVKSYGNREFDLKSFEQELQLHGLLASQEGLRIKDDFEKNTSSCLIYGITNKDVEYITITNGVEILTTTVQRAFGFLINFDINETVYYLTAMNGQKELFKEKQINLILPPLRTSLALQYGRFKLYNQIIFLPSGRRDSPSYEIVVGDGANEVHISMITKHLSSLANVIKEIKLRLDNQAKAIAWASNIVDKNEYEDMSFYVSELDRYKRKYDIVNSALTELLG